MGKMDEAVGERVRAARESRGYTLTALAEKTAIGVSVLSKLETGRLPWGLERLDAVAEALDVPIGQFFETGPMRVGMIVSEKERDLLVELRREPADQLEVIRRALIAMGLRKE